MSGSSKSISTVKYLYSYKISKEGENRNVDGHYKGIFYYFFFSSLTGIHPRHSRDQPCQFRNYMLQLRKRVVPSLGIICYSEAYKFKKRRWEGSQLCGIRLGIVNCLCSHHVRAYRQERGNGRFGAVGEWKLLFSGKWKEEKGRRVKICTCK
jgi:hypothetical protein